MAVNIAGTPDAAPTSLVSPVLQLGLVAGLFGLARWSALHAPQVRATDQWVYNGLAVTCALAGALFLPFALVALGVVVRNRLRRRSRARDDTAR
ncbi:MAG: hypothetical protein ACRCYR_06485 [Phycicoccus sp.]